MLVSSLRCKVVCISKPFAIASLRMQAHTHARNHTSVQQNHVGSSFTFKHKEADDQMQTRKQSSLSCVCISLENGFLGKIRPFINAMADLGLCRNWRESWWLVCWGRPEGSQALPPELSDLLGCLLAPGDLLQDLWYVNGLLCSLGCPNARLSLCELGQRFNGLEISFGICSLKYPVPLINSRSGASLVFSGK